MKHIKNLIFILVLPIVIISLTCTKISAKQEINSPLSPALSVISYNLQMKKSGLVDTSLHFTAKDFEDFMLVDNLKSITITSLPSEFEGNLYLEDVPVISNQTIYNKDINKLHFIPTSSDISSSNFHFFGNGMSCESSIKCSLYFLPELNTSPTIVQNVNKGESLTTLKNIMMYSTLHAEDSENDQLFFEICTQPEHGIVSLSDASSGKFTYTPALNYVGKDKFEYVVYDAYGNRSNKAWVKINVEKNDDNAFFTDMLRHEDHNTAIKATKYKIMSGKIIDGKMCFSPDSTITKAEFITMAMKACGINSKKDVINTGFTDDNDIPISLKSYIAYAADAGYIQGTKTDEGVFFYPNAPITRAEAAVMISALINIDHNQNDITLNDISDIPSWAEKDVLTVVGLDIIDTLPDGNYSPNTNVTNALGANIFCNLYEISQK